LYFDLGDFIQAKRWIDRSIEIAPSHGLALLSKAILSAHDGDWDRVERYVDAALANHPEWQIAMAVRLAADQRMNGYAEARARYAVAYPELLANGAPEFDRRTVRAATDLAAVLIHTGELNRANMLLERARQYAQKFPRAGPRGDELAEARILAVQGNDDAAVLALRRAVDNGWRAFWRSTLFLDPAFERLRDKPQFQAIREQLDAEMAVQLARVQKMESAGELAAQPRQ
jgi:tetratricopeptide (TPR) repeat protein